MSGPRIGALFAGYGGLDMAVSEVFGGEMAWYSEIDKGALKILSHRFPEVPNVGSVTEADWSQVEPVDILTGGSPCQDLSHAGRRAGMTEGTRSNLWVAMREAIAQLRPSVVVWENVRGAYSAEADSALEFCAGCMGDAWYRGAALRALGRVLGDLSDLGYDCRWHGLRAADIGAPHGRFRVFVVAADADGRLDLASGAWADQRAVSHSDGRGAAAALLPTPRCADGMHANLRPHATDTSRLEDAVAVHLMPTPRATDGTKGGPNQRGSSGDLMLPSAVALLPTPTVQHSARNSTAGRSEGARTHADGDTLADLVFNGRLLPTPAYTRWGDYTIAITRWENMVGRLAPWPTMTSTKGNPQLSPAFVEWMMGLPAGWVTDVPGITRNEALKALGNGVVPQQAAAALRTMLAWEVAA